MRTICDGRVRADLYQVNSFPNYMFTLTLTGHPMGALVVENWGEDMYVSFTFPLRPGRSKIIANPGLFWYGPDVVYHWVRLWVPEWFGWAGLP